MKIKCLKISILIVLVVAFFAPSCLAKTEGYFYVVAYSFKDKIAYYSLIFVQKVEDASFSDEEYVADIKLLRKIETAFKSHLVGRTRVDLSKYTLGGRGAFKSLAIAKKRRDSEIKDYSNRGLTVNETPNFKF